MKTPEEYIKLQTNSFFPSFKFLENDCVPVNDVIAIIKQAQLDAIEEAVKRCAINADIKIEADNTFYIDKNSIFKVAEQLRKEIES